MQNIISSASPDLMKKVLTPVYGDGPLPGLPPSAALSASPPGVFGLLDPAHASGSGRAILVPNACLPTPPERVVTADPRQEISDFDESAKIQSDPPRLRTCDRILASRLHRAGLG